MADDNANAAKSSYKDPPSWGPQDRMTFKEYIKKLENWIQLTDLKPHKICTAIIMNLRGLAHEVGDAMTLTEREEVTLVNGRYLTPVETLLYKIRCALGSTIEEAQHRIIHEWRNFKRQQGEPVDAFILRFELARMRAENEGGIVSTPTDLCDRLLSQVGMSQVERFFLLQMFDFKYPTTMEGYDAVLQKVRRMSRMAHEQTQSHGRERLLFANQETGSYQTITRANTDI